MRIIAGAHRGRQLTAPRDRRIRPTGDRAREALFGILEHGTPPLLGARFLDLFCGTGAVGLEAHSRGASQVLGVDLDREAIAVATANHARLGAPATVQLRTADATRLGRATMTFDLVFLDPPYRSELALPALRALLAQGWLAPDARVIVEQAAGEHLELPPSYTADQQRRYGKATFLFLHALPAAQG
jgi:16S rRNA (guanine966-N2)-methyltransferase